VGASESVDHSKSRDLYRSEGIALSEESMSKRNIGETLSNQAKGPLSMGGEFAQSLGGTEKIRWTTFSNDDLSLKKFPF